MSEQPDRPEGGPFNGLIAEVGAPLGLSLT
jgi:hypothetical protein